MSKKPLSGLSVPQFSHQDVDRETRLLMDQFVNELKDLPGENVAEKAQVFIGDPLRSIHFKPQELRNAIADRLEQMDRADPAILGLLSGQVSSNNSSRAGRHG